MIHFHYKMFVLSAHEGCAIDIRCSFLRTSGDRRVRVIRDADKEEAWNDPHPGCWHDKQDWLYVSDIFLTIFYAAIAAFFLLIIANANYYYLRQHICYLRKSGHGFSFHDIIRVIFVVPHLDLLLTLLHCNYQTVYAGTLPLCARLAWLKPSLLHFQGCAGMVHWVTYVLLT